jgi:hypothetical protein
MPLSHLFELIRQSVWKAHTAHFALTVFSRKF